MLKHLRFRVLVFFKCWCRILKELYFSLTYTLEEGLTCRATNVHWCLFDLLLYSVIQVKSMCVCGRHPCVVPLLMVQMERSVGRQLVIKSSVCGDVDYKVLQGVGNAVKLFLKTTDITTPSKHTLSHACKETTPHCACDKLYNKQKLYIILTQCLLLIILINSQL